MCGFLFQYAPMLGATEGTKEILSGLRKLRHRGPDEQHTSRCGSAYFGHVRLSIIDLDESHQPMRSPDGRYTLVFNGEIYNYRELLSVLSPKWQFRTQGDTEVLLAGLIVYGDQFLTRLEGMWAFALWDSHQQSLLLSRDRMGKKPLFYFQAQNGFACGSELPALRHLSRGSWAEDLDSTADYFRYGFCLPGYTAWDQVFEVLPGHWLRWSPGKPAEQKQYWQLPVHGNEAPPATDEDLHEALNEAVAKRLIADVEVGAFLSGGIDSSLVCALAQRQMDRPLRTFTIAFEEKTYDESVNAGRVASHLGTDHRCENFASWEEHVLEALLRDHVGQPFADSSLLPTSLVSQVAAKDVKVALSGDGADELFGGYQRYQARLILRWYSRLPSGLKKLAEFAIRSLPESTDHHSRSWAKKAHLFMDITQRQRGEAHYTAPLVFHPNEYARLFPELITRGHVPYGLPEQTGLQDLQQMLCSDALVYLPQDILAKVDRASMAASLEVRAPFLDHKVVELAFGRRASRHLRVGQGKRWLRTSFIGLLPRETWQRRKQGFAVPVHQWFRDGLSDRFRVLLDNIGAPINKRCAKNLLLEHQSGQRDNGYRLWLLYAYLIVNQP